MTKRGKNDEEKAEGTKRSAALAENVEGARRDCGKGKPFFGGDDVGFVYRVPLKSIAQTCFLTLLIANTAFQKKKKQKDCQLPSHAKLYTGHHPRPLFPPKNKSA